MIQEFKDLSPEEVDLMISVPALVCVLIAGADNKIDKSEIAEAIALIKLKQTRARHELLEYYRAVIETFEKQITELQDKYNLPVEERSATISGELEKVNPILKKLPKTFAIKFYASIKDVAKKIAESSGGVLGFLTVGYEESKLVDLKMIIDPTR